MFPKRQWNQGIAETLLYLSVHSDAREHLFPLTDKPVPMDPASLRLTLAYVFWTGQGIGKWKSSIPHHIMKVLGTGLGVCVRAAILVNIPLAEPGGFTAKTKSW